MVDDDGTRAKGAKFAAGSGSMFALGIVDEGYKPDMSEEEACELGRRAVFHATHRDSGSGGCIRVYLVREEGWTCVSENDMDDLLEYYKEKGYKMPQ